MSLMTEIYFRDYPDVNLFCLIAKGEIAGHLVAVFYLDETDKWIEKKKTDFLHGFENMYLISQFSLSTLDLMLKAK